jgi:hypothetical protein
MDAAWAIPMLFPELAGPCFGVPDFHPDAIQRYAFRVGAAMMIGWTALLPWADREPVRRRGVLLLTVVPVKVCLDLASLALPLAGIVPVGRFLLTKIDSVAIYALFIFSYAYSSGLARKGRGMELLGDRGIEARK